MRKTIAKSKNEVSVQKQEVSCFNKEEEIDFQRTPLKQPDSIRELKTQSSALKSLKVMVFNHDILMNCNYFLFVSAINTFAR